MKKIFFLSAAKLYRKGRSSFCKNRNQKMCRELSQLYPWEDVEKSYDDFQIRKMVLVFVILTIGIVSAVCFHLCSRMEGRLAEGAQLVRNEWGAGDYQIMLQAKAGEWAREIPFLVEERKLTDKERGELLESLYMALPDIIKNENQDLSHVSGDLNLVSALTEYPFTLTWSSGNNERIDRNGKVDRKGISAEGEWVMLTLTVSDGHERIRFDYEILLLPEALSKEESFFRSLEDSLWKINEEQGSRKEIFLPENINGKRIAWEEIKPDNSIFLILLSILCSILAYRGMDNDLERNCRKRNRQLIIDYPGFVSRLRLYLSAGLTVKSAFMKMNLDYQGQKEKRRYLYEEIKIACCQLENGVMEEQVYQEWGRRCGEMRYRRLSFLLAVNLKQGNSRLLMLLSQEADSAQEDRMGMARKAGEEAGTKMLLPMMLMLAVVMFLILLPAYMDFGGI